MWLVYKVEYFLIIFLWEYEIGNYIYREFWFDNNIVLLV